MGHARNRSQSITKMKLRLLKPIREIKAQYTAMIRDTDAAYGTGIRKAEAICLASTS